MSRVSLFRRADGRDNLPVTNLKGLVSRSSSDMSAVSELRGVAEGVGGAQWQEVLM